jgi:hypothetical protein
MTVLDITPLRCALEACGVRVDLIPQTIKRLTRPPISLRISASDGPKTEIPFDQDTAARMFRLNEGKPDPEVTWTKLARLERKRAERLWHWAVNEPDGFNVAPQGRPPDIDSVLVVYCARVICEASGQRQFKFRRPMGGGAPGGPMWCALVKALPSEFRNSPETIAEIITATRSKKFAKLCETLGLGPASSDIDRDPATLRLAISLTRRSRPRKRR